MEHAEDPNAFGAFYDRYEDQLLASAGNATHTIPVTAPLGAYLLVQPLAARHAQTLGQIVPFASPGSSPSPR